MNKLRVVLSQPLIYLLSFNRDRNWDCLIFYNISYRIFGCGTLVIVLCAICTCGNLNFRVVSRLQNNWRICLYLNFHVSNLQKIYYHSYWAEEQFLALAQTFV